MIEWYLETVKDPEITTSFVINEFRPYFIGRKRGHDIITTNPLVSRNHGIFTLHPDFSIYIKDTNSSNGIWVNDVKIKPNVDHLLQDGDLIGVGGPTTANENPELYKIYFRTLNKPKTCIKISDINKHSSSSSNEDINNIPENEKIPDKNLCNQSIQTDPSQDANNKIINVNIDNNKNAEKLVNNDNISNKVSTEEALGEKNISNCNERNNAAIISPRNNEMQTAPILDNNQGKSNNLCKVNLSDNKISKIILDDDNSIQNSDFSLDLNDKHFDFVQTSTPKPNSETSNKLNFRVSNVQNINLSLEKINQQNEIIKLPDKIVATTKVKVEQPVNSNNISSQINSLPENKPNINNRNSLVTEENNKNIEVIDLSDEDIFAEKENESNNGPELGPSDILPNIKTENSIKSEPIDSQFDKIETAAVKTINSNSVIILDDDDDDDAENVPNINIKKENLNNSYSFSQDNDVVEILSDEEDFFPRSQLFDDIDIKSEPPENEAPEKEISRGEITPEPDYDHQEYDIFGNIKKEVEDDIYEIEDDDDDDDDDCRIWLEKLSQGQDILSCSQEFDRLRKIDIDRYEDEEDIFAKFDDKDLELDEHDNKVEKDVARNESIIEDKTKDVKEKKEKDKEVKEKDIPDAVKSDKSDEEENLAIKVPEKIESSRKSTELNLQQTSIVEKKHEKSSHEKSKKREHSKKSYTKPPVIDAPFLFKGKRKVPEDTKVHESIKIKKSKPDEEHQQPSTSTSTSTSGLISTSNISLIIDKSVRDELNKRHKSRRKSVDTMSKNEKNQIQEERKKKLKELAEKQNENKKNEKVAKKSSTPKVKVSNSRGLFLTDVDSDKKESENKSKVKDRKKSEHKSSSSKKDDSESKKRRSPPPEENEKKKYKIPKITHDDKNNSSSNKPKEKHEKSSTDKENILHVKSDSKEHKENKKIETPVNGTVPVKPKVIKSILKTINGVKNTNRVRFNEHVEKKFVEKYLPSINQRNIAEKNIYNIVDEIIKQILVWSPKWLEEQKTTIACPQLTPRPPLKMCYNFNSVKDYYNIVTPLMLMELWRSVFKDWCCIRSPTILGSVDNLNEIPFMTNYLHLYCHCLTIQGKPDINLNRGDLCIVEIMINDGAVSSGIGSTTKLGYIKDVQRKKITKSDMFNFNLISGEQIPEYKISYTILIKKITVSLCDRRLIRTRLVSRIDPPLRLFKSVSYLEKSLLCSFVLKPTIKDYKISKPSNMQLAIKDELNREQLICVYEACQICTRDEPGIYLIQGPPGTGKSFVIKNIVRQLIYGEKSKRENMRLLICAPSNGAVDELTCKLLDLRATFKQNERFKMIRLGPPNSITNPKVRAITLPELIRRQMDSSQYKFLYGNNLMEDQYNGLLSRIHKIEHKIASMKQRGEETTIDEIKLVKAREDLERFKSRDLSLHEKRKRERELEEYFIENADIICTTLSSCMSYRMEELYKENKIRLNCCIIDEATQSNEQENLIPLMLGINKIILVGDTNQLPPTILSQEAKNLGYGKSLFDRIQHNLEHLPENPIRMLTEQYRMHPEICKFPSDTFYHGKLKASSLVLNHIENILHPYRIFCLKTAIDATESAYLNKAEANLVLLLANIVLKRTGYNIGIITPYTQQKEYLMASYKQMRKGQAETKEEANNPKLVINTVDGFQGQERDVIIISCVRIKSNVFLADYQRLNVALTRAKRAVFICAHAHLFENDSIWKKIEVDAKKRNVWFHLTDHEITQEQHMTTLICK